MQFTGSDYRPNTFAGISTVQASRSLLDMPIDDDESNRPFSSVIGGVHSRGGNEREVGLAMLSKACGHIRGRFLLLFAIRIEGAGDLFHRHLNRKFF